jgi:CRP-like cAMP-binding protein
VQHLRKHLEAFKILSQEEIALFESKLRQRKVKKGGFFIKEGAVCKEIAYIDSGLLRSYYHTSSDEEVTYCFSFANSFTSAYSSYLSQSKTQENIEALTDTLIYTISREDILNLEKASYNWLKLFKQIAEQEYINMEKRIFMLQKETAEQRYRDLLANHPQYLQLIPLSYLASYLGITQRHLSRIRRSISN